MANSGDGGPWGWRTLGMANSGDGGCSKIGLHGTIDLDYSHHRACTLSSGKPKKMTCCWKILAQESFGECSRFGEIFP
jgi:hypothetical protein